MPDKVTLWVTFYHPQKHVLTIGSDQKIRNDVLYSNSVIMIEYMESCYVLNKDTRKHKTIRLWNFYVSTSLNSIANTRGPKDVAPFHLLLIFENPNGFEM